MLSRVRVVQSLWRIPRVDLGLGLLLLGLGGAFDRAVVAHLLLHDLARLSRLCCRRWHHLGRCESHGYPRPGVRHEARQLPARVHDCHACHGDGALRMGRQRLHTVAGVASANRKHMPLWHLHPVHRRHGACCRRQRRVVQGSNHGQAKPWQPHDGAGIKETR